MDASLNIVDLIENNPIIKLSHECTNRFINKIKETFTETQQQLFVSSFYCYLNYNQTTLLLRKIIKFCTVNHQIKQMIPEVVTIKKRLC
jgi:hypothetical protein